MKQLHFCCATESKVPRESHFPLSRCKLREMRLIDESSVEAKLCTRIIIWRALIFSANTTVQRN